MPSWRDKAHRIIAEESRRSYLAANTTRRGTRRKRHRPYSVPAVAEALVECLNRDDEERAKAIFLRRALNNLTPTPSKG